MPRFAWPLIILDVINGFGLIIYGIEIAIKMKIEKDAETRKEQHGDDK